MDELSYKQQLEMCSLALEELDRKYEELNEKYELVVVDAEKARAALSTASAIISNMKICESCDD